METLMSWEEVGAGRVGAGDVFGPVFLGGELGCL